MMKIAGLRRLLAIVLLGVFAGSVAVGGESDGGGCSPRELSQYRKGVSSLLPAFVEFGPCQGNRVPLLDQSGRGIGFLLLAPSGPYERLEGYRDTINMAVVSTPEMRVAGVLAGKNRESRKFIRRIEQSGFMKKWNGLSLGAAAALEVDAVTHATYSSEAMKAEIKTVLKTATSGMKTGGPEQKTGK